MIVIPFKFEFEFATYSDAITLEEDHTLTDQDIEDIKQQRLNTWLSIIRGESIT